MPGASWRGAPGAQGVTSVPAVALGLRGNWQRTRLSPFTLISEIPLENAVFLRRRIIFVYM